MDIHSIFLIIFSFGLGLGLGTSVLSSALILFSSEDKKISNDEFSLVKKSRYIIWFSVLLYGIGGLGLFAISYEVMMQSGIFFASMFIALVMIATEIFFWFNGLPKLKSGFFHKGKADAQIFIGQIISAVSWLFLVLHHTFYWSEIGAFLFITIYVVVIFSTALIYRLVYKNNLSAKDALMLESFSAIAFALLVVSLFLSIKYDPKYQAPQENVPQVSESVFYNIEEVASHNKPEDCWLIIDNKVFDVTETAKLHPAMFHCGADASVNYHKNHGPTIRDKMMKFYIGELRGDSSGQIDKQDIKNETLNPVREIYVKEGDWNSLDLMVIVEKDAEDLLFVDGNNLREIGRIRDVGYQPHTSVFSEDGQYMFIISRDGWLSKIDIKNLQPITSIKVGINSRGTALTDDGKYIAVGNYEPGNLVIVDAERMEVLKVISLNGELVGKSVESRAGAVVEDGSKIIVALKDLNSVWVVDTTQPDFPVVNKFWGIGGDVPTLHDAFLTPDGKHYLVASQGSKTVWILDVKNMKPIKEVLTGETPHTGPGATWGDYIYVPALGEGLITVIDSKTWEVVGYIKTGGPGLFVRSYSKDPTYPYVWADTSFGDFKDEIYVIDARVNKIIKTLVPVEDKSSWHPEFSYDGKKVFVVSQEGNEVTVYDSKTFEVLKRIKSETPSAVSNVGLRIEEPGL